VSHQTISLRSSNQHVQTDHALGHGMIRTHRGLHDVAVQGTAVQLGGFVDLGREPSEPLVPCPPGHARGRRVYRTRGGR